MIPASFTRVCLALLATTSWMVVSSYLIILNRHIMVDLKFAYPMTLSGMGMICSWLLSLLCCKVFGVVETKASVPFSFWAARILPVGFFMAVTLWSGNEVYMYLTVSFIQMLKAFTPVITMVCLSIAGLETPTGPMISSVLFLSMGIALAAYGEVNTSIIGLIINTTSAVSESIRLVMTQWLLTGLKFHPIEGLLYLAPACILWLYSGAAVVELPTMIRDSAWDIILAHPLKFAVAAGLGFLVNILAFWSIKLASSLTLKVLGTVKNTLIVVGSVMMLGEVVTLLQGVGYGIAILGFAWYTKIKTVQIADHGAAKERAKLENQPIKPIVDSMGSVANLTQPLLTFKTSSGSLNSLNSLNDKV